MVDIKNNEGVQETLWKMKPRVTLHVLICAYLNEKVCFHVNSFVLVVHLLVLFGFVLANCLSAL